MFLTPPLKLYLGGVRKHKMNKNARAPAINSTLYNAETETMLKNKLSEEKRESPVGKPPPSS